VQLGITPDQGVALVNAPPECALAISVADGSGPDRADVVIGFITRRADLDLLSPVGAAAHADRTAWAAYPKPGQLGTDIAREWLGRAVRLYGVKVIQQVSLDGTWSAVLLQPIEEDEGEAHAADIEAAWPGP
jgi:hypothetical protein